jgi:general secretion pathway protein K
MSPQPIASCESIRLVSRTWTQRGAALLMAMLTVALVATFASAALWQQSRSIEVERAERSHAASSWVLVGALDWARLLLREDARAGNVDHLAEPWAIPLQEARLSTFLAADKGGATDVETQAPEAFLSGQITDMQSFLNVRNLLDANRISDSGLHAFARLFDVLGLPPSELTLLAENLRLAADPIAQFAPTTPLMPQKVDDLAWLGLSRPTIATLKPYITLLPVRTPINLNTASAQVIYASIDGLNLAEVQRLVADRERTPFLSLGDATKLLPGHEAALQGTQDLSVASRYFGIRARLRFDQDIVEEQSVVERSAQVVKVLVRDRAVARAAERLVPSQ